jgi:hypothetical protein
MIRSIEFRGKLVEECGLRGERFEDDVFPGHPNGVRLSRHVWMLLYCTRGWRAVDDDRSAVYQLRRGGYDGTLIREGFFQASVDDWDALGDGRRFVRQQGHPCVFGVPKGARVDGKPVANANVFVAKWRVKAKGIFDPATGGIIEDREAVSKTQDIEWLQFRLNDAEDDIEILCPVGKLRQKGSAPDTPCGGHAELRHMNMAFVQAIPLNAHGTEWADLHHFQEHSNGLNDHDPGQVIAPLRYAWNRETGLYEWVETGPVMRCALSGLTEGSIARTTTGFVLAARGNNAIGWCRSPNPFQILPSPTLSTSPAINAPICVYACPDGVVRLFTGDKDLSPYGNGRNPLYCWDVNPQTLEIDNPTEIFDCVRTGTLPQETIPRAEMCKLLPYDGGGKQVLVWRVRTKNVGVPYGSLPPVTEKMKRAHGLYYAVVHYDRDYPGPWKFDTRLITDSRTASPVPDAGVCSTLHQRCSTSQSS